MGWKLYNFFEVRPSHYIYLFPEGILFNERNQGEIANTETAMRRGSVLRFSSLMRRRRYISFLAPWFLKLATSLFLNESLHIKNH